jgi:hypothetical protein
MNRQEFIEYANTVINDGGWKMDITADDCPLWIPEKRDGWVPTFYLTKVFIRGVRLNSTSPTFWQWCQNNLSKLPLCYMSNSAKKEEWWGFNTKEDAILFTMKWA